MHCVTPEMQLPSTFRDWDRVSLGGGPERVRRRRDAYFNEYKKSDPENTFMKHYSDNNGGLRRKREFNKMYILKHTQR